MKSLIILDVQNDFTPGGSLEVPDGDLVVPVINMMHDYFDLVVATQDWHPHNHVSFVSNHPDERPFNKIEVDGIDQVLWPDHCVQGTMGAMFHPHLETDRFSAIFRKGMNPYVDSYSGFYDNRHQVSTGLAGYLKDKGATELYFCGLAGDICVYHTIIDAIKEGFSSTLIEDASRPLNQQTFAFLKKELVNKGVRIINSDEIITI
ncbi:MAG: bifunctional nicotinamidase/pyrazinamidase [Bacteroidales bacterium]